MKCIVKFEREELLNVLIALQNEADRLESLALSLPDKELARKFTLQARDARTLYRKILDTYESID